MFRFLWFGVALMISCVRPSHGSGELQFYYIPLNFESLVAIKREYIRESALCRGIVKEPLSTALRAIVSKMLISPEKKFDEARVRVLVEGVGLELYMYATKLLSEGVAPYFPTYVLTDEQVKEFLEILRSTEAAKKCQPSFHPKIL